MSLPRYAARTDTSQPEIIKALEQAKVRVWVIRLPCDLLCQFYCSRHGIWCWQTLECKTLDRRGRPRRRKDQHKQDEFLELTNTPVVTSFDEAWKILNVRHHLGPAPA